MNKKRGLLLVVFLLGLAMVVSVDVRATTSTCPDFPTDEDQPGWNRRCEGALTPLGDFFFSTDPDGDCIDVCEEHNAICCQIVRSGDERGLCQMGNLDDLEWGLSRKAVICEEGEEGEGNGDDNGGADIVTICDSFSIHNSCGAGIAIGDTGNKCPNNNAGTCEEWCKDICESYLQTSCCKLYIEEGNYYCQALEGSGLTGDDINDEWGADCDQYEVDDPGPPPPPPPENQEDCEGSPFHGDWLDDCGCCYHAREGENCGSYYCEYVEDYEWLSLWGNVSSGYPCGTHEFRCVGPEGCNQILDKNSCETSSLGCSWVDSDLGGILDTPAGDTLCLPEPNPVNSLHHTFPQYPDDWDFYSPSEIRIRTLNISNGELVFDFLGHGPSGTWFTCDAFSTNYLVSVDGEDNVLSLFDKPSYIDADETFSLNNYICYGHSFESKTSDPEDVFKVQSKFAKCDHDNWFEPLYKIGAGFSNTINPSASGIVRYQVQLNDIKNLNDFTELSFFMKIANENQSLSEIRFFDGNNHLAAAPIYKAQDTNVKNWTRYTVNLSDINQFLSYSTRFFIYFTGSESTYIERSQFSLTFMGEEYFCGYDGNEYAWINNLSDATYGEQTCDAQQSFAWTGSQCCGYETKFGNYELYTDLDGGCFMGIPTMDGHLVYDQSGKEEHKSILYFDDEFIGCDINVSEYIDAIYNGLNYPNDFNNHSQADTCEIKGDYYCGVHRTWMRTNGQEDYSLRYSPGFSSRQCCPGNECWDGTDCVDEFEFNDNNDKVCIEGLWINKNDATKYNPMRNVSGFCSLDRCYHHDDNLGDLFFPGGNLIPNPADGGGSCVPSHYHRGDAYCLNGKWRSKPMMIASVFLNFTEENDIQNYTLLCDNQTNVLNKLMKDFEGMPSEGYIASSDYNVCLLSYYDGDTEIRLLGVSGNITAIEKYLGTWQGHIEEGLCDLDNEEDYNKFVHCGYYQDKQINLYVNKHMGSLIIQRYNHDPTLTFFQALIRFLMNPINAIIEFIRGQEKPINFGTLGEVMLPDDIYDTFYLSKNNGKEIFGYVRNYNYQESGSNINNYIFAEYKNIRENVCQRIYPLVFEEMPNNPRLLCEPHVNNSEWTFLIRSERDSFDAFFNLNAFNALTSELRISDQQNDFEFIYFEFNETPVVNKEFKVDLKKFNGNEVPISGDVTWEFKRRTTPGMGWDNLTIWGNSFGECTSYGNFSVCDLTDLEIEYKLVATNNKGLRTERVFVLDEEEDTEKGSNSISPGSPYYGDILFANFYYDGYKDIEIIWEKENSPINACNNQIYCDVFGEGQYEQDANYRFRIYEEGNNIPNITSPPKSFNYCGDEHHEPKYEDCDSVGYCTSLCTYKPINCNGNFMLPCQAYGQASCSNVAGCEWNHGIPHGSCSGTPYCCDETTCNDNCRSGCGFANLKCTTLNSNQIKLDYTFSKNTDTVNLTYRLNPNNAWNEIDSSSYEEGTFTYDHQGLDPDTTYYYRLNVPGIHLHPSIYDECTSFAEDPEPPECTKDSDCPPNERCHQGSCYDSTACENNDYDDVCVNCAFNSATEKFEIIYDINPLCIEGDEGKSVCYEGEIVLCDIAISDPSMPCWDCCCQEYGGYDGCICNPNNNHCAEFLPGNHWGNCAVQ